MTTEDQLQEIRDSYDMDAAVSDLAAHNYAVTNRYNDATLHVYVQESQTAGGELKAILNRHGYDPTYPSPFDGDEFSFVVVCEPHLWNCPRKP